MTTATSPVEMQPTAADSSSWFMQLTNLMKDESIAKLPYNQFSDGTPVTREAVTRRVTRLISDMTNGECVTLANFHNNGGSDEMKMQTYEDIAHLIVHNDWPTEPAEPDKPADLGPDYTGGVSQAEETPSTEGDIEAVVLEHKPGLPEKEEEPTRFNALPNMPEAIELNAEQCFKDGNAYVNDIQLTAYHRGLSDAETQAQQHIQGLKRRLTLAERRVQSNGDAVEGNVNSPLRIPKVDTNFIVTPEQENQMEIIAGLSDHLGAFNALLTGPTGCGKTEFAIQLAARFGMPFLKMDCSVVREPERWFGNQYAKDGSTGWHTAEYIKAVEQGGCVILHDELNRVSEYVKNPLLGLFDDTRQVFLDIAGKTFHVGHGTIMLATMNEGAEFTGTGALDLAFQNRFGFRIETNYLNSDDETKVLVNKTGIDEASAKHLVEIASTIRGKSKGLGAVINQGLSTRQLLNAAHAFVHPKGGIAALQATIANHFDATGGTSSERAQVLTLLQGKFGADIQTIDAHTEDIVAADIS